MNRRYQLFNPVVAMLAVTLLVAAMGCASGPQEDSQPEEIVGQPPTEDSEDHEFAPPPEHPGAHGSVDRSDGADISVQPGVIDEAALDELQSYGPSVVMQHIETSPVHEDGEFVGFEIVDASETAAAYMESTLEIGDVITHVNLVRLERPDDYMEAWETLEEADEIRVDVVRDDEPIEVVWEIE